MTKETVGSISAASSAAYYETEFKWKIKNFRTSCKNVGDALLSPIFAADRINRDVLCCLKLYPKGDMENSKDYVSIYLHIDAEITAIGTFTIFDKYGLEVQKSKMSEHLFSKREWGYSKFISRSVVQNAEKGILDNDALTIGCRIEYKCTSKMLSSETISGNEAKKKKFEEVDSARLVSDECETLVNVTKFSDATLVCDGRRIKVHKCILAKKSPVFAAMFGSDTHEGQENIVRISDIKYDVLVELLRFVYSGKISDVGTMAGELAVVSNKYALDDLKITCERTMGANLSLDNVIKCLGLAERLRMDELKKHGIDFIIKNAKDISDKADFNSLSHDIVCEVFHRMAANNGQ